MQIGGRIRTLYQSESDADLGGFSVRNARLYATGTTAGDIGYRVEVDFNGAGANELGLLDAYLDIPVGGEFSARVGQFRAHVSREALIDSGNLFFVERSAIANHFSGRSQGIAFSGDMGGFDVALTIQNGDDGVTDELFYAVRGGFDLMGGGTDLVEGAYGAGEEMEASAAVAYFSDEAVEDADGFLVEASLATGQFSAQASFLSLGDAISTSNVDNENPGNLQPRGGHHPHQPAGHLHGQRRLGTRRSLPGLRRHRGLDAHGPRRQLLRQRPRLQVHHQLGEPQL